MQLEREHCGFPDSLVLFKTPQTRGKKIVLPCAQWKYVIDGADAVKKDDRTKLDGTCGIPGRNGEPLSAYKHKMAEFNLRLSSKGHVPLEAEELICGRLYTGPMCTLHPQNSSMPRIATACLVFSGHAYPVCPMHRC